MRLSGLRRRDLPARPQSTPSVHFGIDVVVPAILELGLKESPKEACGVVVPDFDMEPHRWVHKMVNRSSSPENSYALDPKTIRQLVEDLRRPNPTWESLLIWHTHPKGNVGPSKADMDAKIPGLRYLVVSLPRGEAVLF